MAKRIESENSSLEALDLISLLSLPSEEAAYDMELSMPDEELDLVALGRQSLKEARAVSGFSVANQTSFKDTKPGYEKTLPSAESKRGIASTAVRPTLAPLIGYESDSFQQIIKDISICQNCTLCKSRKNVVPGMGNQQAKLVLVGEAPGADEDAQGIPFVGKAGKHLDKILAAAGFKKEDIYICNILKCRPPNNRDPNLAEMKACTPFLQRQLALMKPQIIGCLGNVAAHYVIGPSVPGITRIRGQWFQSIFGIPTFPMYHPSYLIRSESREKGSPNWQMWQDIRVLKAKYDALLKKTD